MEDIIIAQKILEQNYSNINNNIYHDSSFMYMTTNENIKSYQKYLNNKNKILSVISSGDQILNTILGGNFNIDGFDISRFPKYILELKIAGIKSLTREEFINFFFEVDKNSEYYDDIYYYKMRNFLEGKYKKFWDGLIDFYDWNDIIKSNLFSSQTVSINSITDNNLYLQNDNYEKLQKIIDRANINYYTGDINDIVLEHNTEYDLINLSSIIYYSNNYKKLLENLKLANNGIALTYLYNVCRQIKENYTNCDFEQFDNTKNGVMIYKKSKN